MDKTFTIRTLLLTGRDAGRRRRNGIVVLATEEALLRHCRHRLAVVFFGLNREDVE